MNSGSKSLRTSLLRRRLTILAVKVTSIRPIMRLRIYANSWRTLRTDMLGVLMLWKKLLIENLRLSQSSLHSSYQFKERSRSLK